MMLVRRRVPVERVAHAIFPGWMATEVHDFVEGFVDDRNAAQGSADATPTLEFFGRHAHTAAAQCVVEPLLPPLVLAIEPNGKPTARPHQTGHRVEHSAR